MAANQYIGGLGTGTFTQTGGTNTITGEGENGTLSLGNSLGASGTYNLGGGTGSPLLSAQTEYIGNFGSGAFNQTGGTHAVGGDLYLGLQIGSSGAYNLSGGSLSATNQYIGGYGSGAFTQSGGTNTVSNTLTLAFPRRQQLL